MDRSATCYTPKRVYYLVDRFPFEIFGHDNRPQRAGVEYNCHVDEDAIIVESRIITFRGSNMVENDVRPHGLENSQELFHFRPFNI